MPAVWEDLTEARTFHKVRGVVLIETILAQPRKLHQSFMHIINSQGLTLSDSMVLKEGSWQPV